MPSLIFIHSAMLGILRALESHASKHERLSLLPQACTNFALVRTFQSIVLPDSGRIAHICQCRVGENNDVTLHMQRQVLENRIGVVTDFDGQDILTAICYAKTAERLCNLASGSVSTWIP